MSPSLLVGQTIISKVRHFFIRSAHWNDFGIHCRLLAFGPIERNKIIEFICVHYGKWYSSVGQDCPHWHYSWRDGDASLLRFMVSGWIQCAAHTHILWSSSSRANLLCGNENLQSTRWPFFMCQRIHRIYVGFAFHCCHLTWIYVYIFSLSLDVHCRSRNHTESHQRTSRRSGLDSLRVIFCFEKKIANKAIYM